MASSKSATDNDDLSSSSDSEMEPLVPCDPQCPEQPASFEYITENVYLTELATSKDRKRAKRMVCDCQFDPEQDDSEDACGENCLNRLLMIECGSRCPCGEYCTNKRFQRATYAKVEVFKTEKKGWGLHALEPIASGQFVMEYCGEVCTPAEFEGRKKDYVIEKRRHYYFMSLKTDEILDATRKGNLSRYINHSCDPNCETQKWTVNGRLRVGFFSVRGIPTGEELTFDYQFQRFGEVAQKCFCESANCRGYLGVTKQMAASGKLLLPSTSREMGSPRSPRGSPRSPSVREGRRKGRTRTQSVADSMFEKEVYEIVGSSWRLKNSDQVIAISRIMLQAESPSQRIMLLQVLQATTDMVCLRKFLSLHGLRLLWSWMVDSSDSDSSDVLQFRVQVLQALSHLPIHTRNQLEDSKVISVVRRWAEKWAKSKPAATTEDPLEDLEGTVVTEADSAPCTSEGEEGEGRGEGDEGVTKAEGEVEGVGDITGTCEAEAREISASESQEEREAAEEKLASEASELLEKWSGLKEVFRIPKRAQPLKKPPSDKDNDKDASQQKQPWEHGEEKEGESEVGRDREERKRERDAEWRTSRHSLVSQESPEPPPTRSRKSRFLLPTPQVQQSPLSSRGRSPRSHMVTQTPYIPHTLTPTATPTTNSTLATANTGYARYTGAGFSASAPVQNTVIVQQPGQSVYVQQQVFQDGCQTTILPAQYIHPPLSHPLAPHPVTTTASTTLAYPPRPSIPTPVPFTSSLPSLPPLPQLDSKQLSQPIQSIQPVHSLQPQSVQALPITQPGLPGLPLVPTPNPLVQPGLMHYPVAQQQATIVAAAAGSLATTSRGAPAATNPVAMAGVVPAIAPTTVPGLVPTPRAAGFQFNINQQYLPNQQVYIQPQSQHLSLAPLPPPPPKEESDLPLHWKTARDPQGKVYYYHTVTRKSQWERPTDQDAEGTITMELATPEHEKSPEGEKKRVAEEEGEENEGSESKGGRNTGMPRTPEGSPPPTPTEEEDSEGSGASPHGLWIPDSPSHSPIPHRTPLSPSRSPHSPRPTHSSSHSRRRHGSRENTPTPHTPPSSLLALTTAEQDSPLRTSPPDDSFFSPSHPTTPSPLLSSQDDTQLPSSPNVLGSSSSPPHSPLDTPPTLQESSAHGPPPTKRHRGDRRSRSRSEHAAKDYFRHKLSKVVTRCLDQHRKLECKYGRITCSEDFKYLARKLTYGLTEKEIDRKGGIDKLVYNDSVKTKVKDYIRQYMKKYGSVYKKS